MYNKSVGVRASSHRRQKEDVMSAATESKMPDLKVLYPAGKRSFHRNHVESQFPADILHNIDAGPVKNHSAADPTDKQRFPVA